MSQQSDSGANPMKMRVKKFQALSRSLFVSGLLAISLPLAAQDFDRGKELYENHCQGCHESWAHERAGRQVSSLGELRQRVAGWSFHSGLDWRDEEIDDVADYLNRQFYQMTR